MKKLFLLAAFFGAFSLGSVTAQSCGQKAGMAAADKKCCAGKPCAATKMASAAKDDPSIEARLDPNGSTFYVRKENDGNGTVRLVDVTFDQPTGKFVNVAPGQAAAATAAPAAGMVKKEASCTPAKKACCKGDAAKSCSKTEAIKE